MSKKPALLYAEHWRVVLVKRFCVVSVFLLTFFSSCDRAEEAKIAPRPGKTGIATLRFYDQSRERPLITEVWYPVDEVAPAAPVEGLWVRCPEARDAPLKARGKQYPLIIMSHGSWSDRLNNSWMAETLVANGYIVASMDHYGNTWNNKIPECFVKLWDRPQDVSFVIDQILQNEKFAPYINPNRIGFVGYSLGGLTGIWIAGGQVAQFDKPLMDAIPAEHVPSSLNEEIISSIDFSPAQHSYKDPRVSAVFVMAPALGYLFDMASLQSISIPVHIVASAGDQVVPLDSSASILASAIKKATLVLISPSASHYVFLNEVTKGGKMLLDKKVALDAPDIDRAKIHEDVGISAVRFFNQHLSTRQK